MTKKDRCPFCGTKRDKNNFFWLVVDKKNRDNCWAEMELEDKSNDKRFDYIEIECCPKCQAEMM